MRIVIVSGLFPPNFVSGATVQAQRIAHGLIGRGHDVRVFAGALNGGPRPLARWETTDERGLTVGWIDTTPWFGFGDVTNYANEHAEKAFAEYLAVHRPEIVHLHVLQGLGGGLTRVASASGAKVVITMHDAWWRCARHFLVDREMKTCCPVVSAGICPCQVDRPWLEARTEWLDRQLRHADLILSPSKIMRDLLAANGIDGPISEVDENGVPAVQPGPSAPSRTEAPDRIRFLYAGGPNELKGSHVLVDALQRLSGLSGWQFDAYGLNGSDDRFVHELSGLPVTLKEPYSAEEAPSVFASSDVLVLPSIARESFSVLTREALSAGVPVITTDSLGPEEVVEHEVNGLIVPSGDAQALASAMKRCIQEPGLVSAMAQRTVGVRLRSIDDQVEGLETRYGQLLRSAPRRASSTVRRVLFIYGIEGAPLRYRVWMPAESLRVLGIESLIRHYRDPEIESLVTSCDAIIVYRVPSTKAVLRFLDRARSHGVPLLFDLDDLIFDPDIYDEVPALKRMPAPESALWLEGVRRYRTTMEACDMFIGSTSFLCAHAETTVGMPVRLFENGVSFRVSRLSDAALRSERQHGPIRIGYLSGTDTHGPDWEWVEPAVRAILERFEQTELWMVGLLPDSDALSRFGDRIKRVPFTRWERLPHLLRQIDINLAPLAPDSRFNEAKSAIKWVEAALVSTPTIASPTTSFRAAITDGQDGLLADSREEWFDAMRRLIEDDVEVKRLGARARREVLFRWSPWLQGPRYLEILEDAVKGPRRMGATEGPPPPALIPDEPPKPTYLEPYGYDLAEEAADAEGATPPLDASGVRFDVRVPNGTTRIDLFVATYGRQGAGLELVLRDGSHRRVRAASIPEHLVQDNAWVAFSFSPIGGRDQVLSASLRPRSQRSRRTTAVWLTREGSHEIAGKVHAGSPCVRVWVVPNSGPGDQPADETGTRAPRSRFRRASDVLSSHGVTAGSVLLARKAMRLLWDVARAKRQR